MKPLRRQVFERDGWMCVACATNHDLTLHHRANRGMGGSKRMDMLSNLLTLCVDCNGRLESDADFADLGRSFGWKISRYATPNQVPVRYTDGVFYYLNDQGKRNG